tara:strand:+ start:574 stop:876 length:303 start_codon:yes stop_codon:yes gene_type:complete
MLRKLLSRKRRESVRTLARTTWICQLKACNEGLTTGTWSGELAAIRAKKRVKDSLNNGFEGIVSSILISIALKLAYKWIEKWLEDKLFGESVPTTFSEKN